MPECITAKATKGVAWSSYPLPAYAITAGAAQKLTVPGKGAIKTGLERELRSPVEDCAGSLGTQELMTNFIACLVEHFRAQRGPHLLQNQFNHVEHTDLDFI